MRWKQFLTPVTSVSAEETQQMLAEQGTVTLLDVRQPGEYQEGHIAGARLVPLAELGEHLDELPTDSPLVVYCAIGGRSRVAAQMLAGKGFSNIFNMTGGYKAWNGWSGYGDYEQGLELFSGSESVQDVLAVAYNMEMALGKFYISMAAKVDNADAAKLFTALATIEEKHKQSVSERYAELSDGKHPETSETASMEGGLSTEEYMQRLGTDTNSPRDIVDFAMAMEAQAMDLYTRAAENAPDDNASSALLGIAQEERGHLAHLATLMDTLVSQ